MRIIKNARNEGFGRGNNIALEQVITPYALLLNPDAIMEEGALATLIEGAQRSPDAAILAPLLYHADGSMQESYKRSVFAREKKGGQFLVPEGDLCADFLSGAIMLLNMEHMKKVGFFDPAIFLYYEDDDLCLRARAAGYGLVLVASAKAVHLMGASSGEEKLATMLFKQRHITWSRMYLERKYHGAKATGKLARKLSLLYIGRAAGSALRLDERKLQRYRARLEAIAAFQVGKQI